MPTGRVGFDLEDPTGLGSLVSGMKSMQEGLFPDPSKFASAGYYGAKTREAQMDANLKADQMNARYRLWQTMNGQNPGGGYAPAPYVGQSGPLMWTAPGQPGGGAPGGGASLGATVAGARPPAIMDPTRTANFVENTVSSGGTAPPPASPPAPGTPAAPNATGSDGSVPPTDPKLPIHPGSVTPAGGGQKQSGPAGPTGKPAAQALNLGQLMALAVQSGMDAGQAKGFISGYIAELYQTGRIDRQTMSELNAQLGEGTIYKEDAHTGRTGMEIAGRKDVAGMEIAGRQKVTETEQAGQDRRTGMGATTVLDENGNPITIPLSKLPEGQGGKPYGGYTPGVETEKQQATTKAQEAARSLVWVEDPNGGYKRVQRSALQPSDRVVDDAVAQSQLETVQVVIPGGGGRTQGKPRWQAVRDGDQIAGKTVEEVRTTAAQASPGAPNLAQTVVPTGTEPKTEFERTQVRQQTADRYYPPRSTDIWKRSGFKGVRFGGAAEQMLDQLTSQFYQDRNDPTTYLQDGAAREKAIRTLQQGIPGQGRLPTANEMDVPAIWDRFKNNVVTDEKGNKFIQIDLVDTPPPQPSVAGTVAGAVAGQSGQGGGGQGGVTYPGGFSGYGGTRAPPTAAAPPPPPAPTGGATGGTTAFSQYPPALPGMTEGKLYNSPTGGQVRIIAGKMVPITNAVPGGGGG